MIIDYDKLQVVDVRIFVVSNETAKSNVGRQPRVFGIVFPLISIDQLVRRVPRQGMYLRPTLFTEHFHFCLRRCASFYKDPPVCITLCQATFVYSIF